MLGSLSIVSLLAKGIGWWIGCNSKRLCCSIRIHCLLIISLCLEPPCLVALIRNLGELMIIIIIIINNRMQIINNNNTM